MFCSLQVLNGEIIYVNSVASGNNDGTSWEHAYRDLQNALAAAEDGDEIWVATGTYLPGSERTDSFILKDGVAIYGGFQGNETSLDRRDVDGNPTILSGDLDQDDDIIGKNRAENSYHVVDGSSRDDSAILDGFIIQKGNANASAGNDAPIIGFGKLATTTMSKTVAQDSSAINSAIENDDEKHSVGGGMLIFGGSPTIISCRFENNSAAKGGGIGIVDQASPTISNCVFNQNSAGERGGAMEISKSFPVIKDCIFMKNSAGANVSGYGGAIYSQLSSSAIERCSFLENTAVDTGGAMLNNGSSPVVTDCNFENNSSLNSGGGVRNNLEASQPEFLRCNFMGNKAGTDSQSDRGGGMINTDSSSPRLMDCRFTGNSAFDGGGMDNGPLTATEMVNCWFEDNRAEGNGGAMKNRDSSPTIKDCTFINNSANDRGGGMHNIFNADPLLFGCLFRGNTANRIGGGMMNDSASPAVNNCLFSHNSTITGGGGGVYTVGALSAPTFVNCSFQNNKAGASGGGIFNLSLSTPILVNCVLVDNFSREDGGAIYNDRSPLTLVNSTFVGNKASARVGGVFNTGAQSATTISNCILFHNTDDRDGSQFKAQFEDVSNASSTIRFCLIQGWPELGVDGNLDGDPGFANASDPVGPDDILGTMDDGVQLLPSSPAIDAGDADVENFLFIDVLGRDRFDFPDVINSGSGDPSYVDMGAYERQADSIIPIVTDEIFVPEGGTDDFHVKLGAPPIDAVTVEVQLVDGDPDIMIESGLTVTFSPEDWDVFQPVTLSAAEDEDAIDSMAVIRISKSAGSNFIADYEANAAEIDNDLRFLVPNGSESWVIGTTRSIKWQATESAEIKIEVSRDNGSSWEEIEASTVSENSRYEWEISGPASTECRIRVLFAEDETVNSVSSSPFEIISRSESRWYVDPSAGGRNNGISWDDAFSSLQDALRDAVTGDEVWVAAGVYTPDSGGIELFGDRTASFRLKNRVAVYGGFKGDEISLDQRDSKSNSTILSGDLNQNDGEEGGDNSENSYHVVNSSGTDDTAILDGFIIRAGNADDKETHLGGGGMWVDNGSPRISNCTFVNNSAREGGGLHLVNQSTPSLINCLIKENNSSSNGGGMAVISSSPILEDCRFVTNESAQNGGGIWNSGNKNGKITNCLFDGNSATRDGGAIYNNELSTLIITECEFTNNSVSSDGGGMANVESSPAIERCNFSNNSASSRGGGIWNNDDSNPQITDCIFSENFSEERGGAMYNGFNSSPTLMNCDFMNNKASSHGGGMSNFSSTPIISGCNFGGNSVPGGLGRDGGGMDNDRASPIISGCNFKGNLAGNGGAIRVLGTLSNPAGTVAVIRDCTFEENEASDEGGGIYIQFSNSTITNCRFVQNSASENGGGLIYKSSSELIVSNCVFVENSTLGEGGGLFMIGSSAFMQIIDSVIINNSAMTFGGGVAAGSGSMRLINCTFTENSAQKVGGIHHLNTTTELANSILWNNTDSTEDILGAQITNSGVSELNITFSTIQGLETENSDGNIALAPLFFNPADPDGEDGLFGTNDDGYHLLPGSPGIDAGNSELEGISGTDIAGNPRYDDRGVINTGIGEPDYVDIGAYERQEDSPIVIVTDLKEVVVPEGESSNLKIKLNSQPFDAVSLTISISGDDDIRLNSEETLNFSPDNWDLEQTVTLTATEDDEDTDNGGADLHIEKSEGNAIIAPLDLRITEVDDDIVLTVTHFVGGTINLASTTFLDTDNMPIEIKAFPNFGFEFLGWTGDTTGIEDPSLPTTTISTLVDASISANFNKPPTILITNPNQGKEFAPPATIDIMGIVGDQDGTIEKVEVFANNELIGEAAYNENEGSWAFAFRRIEGDTGNFVLRALATDNTGLRTESDPIEISVSDFDVTFIRPGPNETAVFAGDAYRFSWDISPDIATLDFFLALLEEPVADKQQIQSADFGHNLNSNANKQGFTREQMPVKEGKSESTWYPHILITSGEQENKIFSAPYPVRVLNEVERENVTMTFIEPQEKKKIFFGQTLPVEALINGESGTSITGSNAVMVRFKELDDDAPIVEIDESSDNGSIKLNNDFAPNSAGTWTVEIEWLGNAQFLPGLQARSFSVSQSNTAILLAPLGQHILGTNLRIVGQLRITTNNPGDVDLSGVPIEFELRNTRDELIPIPLTQTTNNPGEINGRFETIIPAETLDHVGDWTLQALTNDTENLFGSFSDQVIIKVRKKAGYAILCQGSIEGQEGVEDHRRTIEYVKETLIAGGRGLDDNPESPNTLTDDIYEIGVGSSKIELEKAIKEWALPKMLEAPAPLYITLINHGETDRFHMHSGGFDSTENILNPDDFNDWLDELQTSFEDQESGNDLAANEKIIIVPGMCFSGSFINEMSKMNRIILSASAANERSIRGPGDADTRHGEFFVYLLFRELSKGLSLFDSFTSSRDTIRQVSSRFELATNSLTSEFPGETGQHPLLDDNGDGRGSFLFPAASGDGQVAKTIFLINPTNSITLGIAHSNPSLFLEPDVDPSGMLWAEVDERPVDGLVKNIFMEVKKPGASGLEGSNSMQAGLELVPQLMKSNDEFSDRVRFEWPGLEPTLDLFNESGVYQIFYYASATADSQISEPKVSFLYRSPGEIDLAEFDLVSPENGAIMDFGSKPELGDVIPGLFRWEKSDCLDDSSQCEIEYFFRLWEDRERTNLLVEAGPDSPPFVSFTPKQLPTNQDSVWWDVVAVEKETGKFLQSTSLFEVTIQQTNQFDDGFLFGKITDKATGELLGEGTVIINNGTFNREIFISRGEYVAIVTGNTTYRVAAEFNDFFPESIQDIRVLPGNKVRIDIQLERREQSVSKFNLRVESEPISDVGLVGSQAGISDYDTEIDSGFTVSVTALPLVINANTGYLFDSWKKDGEFLSRENVITPFALEKDTTITAVYKQIGITLHPGWNLVSTPVNLSSERSVDEFFNANTVGSIVSSSVWSWNEGRFELVEHFEPGKAYWVRSSESVHLEIPGNTPGHLVRDSRQGWNLIGVNGLGLLSSPDEDEIVGNIWAWDPMNQRYYTIDSESLPDFKQNKLISGEGYWLFFKTIKNETGGP